jgi:O-antigen/teichoic acid export membrane protein
VVSQGAAKILVNAKYLYLALLTSQGLRFVYMLILARMLGSELYGLFSYGQSWYLMFLPLTGLGLGAMLSREVGKNRENAKSIVDLVASIRLGAVGIVAIISMICGIFYAENQFVATLLTIFSVALIGKAMILWANQMFQAFESTHVIFKIERIFKPCEILVSIAVAVITKNILLIACVHAIGQIVQGLVSIHLVTKAHTNINLIFEPRLMAATVSKLSPLAVAIVAGQYMFFGPIVQSRELLNSSEQHSNFSLLIQLFVVCLSIFSSIASAALPALSRSVSYNRDSLNLFSRITIYSACMSGIFIFIFSELIGAYLLRFAFSSQFSLASEYLSLMMLVLIPAVITSLLNSVQISLENNFRVFFTNTLAAGVLIVSMPIFIGIYDFKGAIYSLLAAFSCSAFVSSFFLLKESIINIRETFFVPFLILSGTSAVIFYGKYVGYMNFSLILGAVYSVTILWLLGLSKKDKESIIMKAKNLKNKKLS